jgi:hypothetical protein
MGSEWSIWIAQLAEEEVFRLTILMSILIGGEDTFLG